MMRHWICFVVVMAFLLSAWSASAHETQPLRCQPPAVQAPQYATVYGSPRPIYATPFRTAIWQVTQPKAYYVPQQQVRVAVPCPHCRRPQ
jgi:hypothetical protein